MNDQRDLWNSKHAANEHAEYRADAAPFAKKVEPLFPDGSEVLELGCGVGGDAYFFAEQGHQVTATDFSETVIEQDKTLLQHPNLDFSLLDISKPLPFADGSFDVVFAHLSLHYYDDATTRKIFAEVARVLRPNGLFCFACKTTQDPEYGDGQELEPDLFLSSKGHLRHFFTVEYATKLLVNDFVLKDIEEVEEQYGPKSANFLRCIAERAA